MQTLHGLDGLRKLPPGSIVSIGNFDGVHLGHRGILDYADTLRAAAPSGKVAVVTFEPHPLTVLRPGHAPPRLTSAAFKAELLAGASVDFSVVVPPVPEVLNLPAEAFWKILAEEAKVAHLVEGENFTFGKGRRGTIARLREWSAGSGVTLHVVDPVTTALLDLHVVSISSSLVRWLIDQGRVRDAAICLGRAYVLEGEIVKGHQRGRAIGMPTANLNCADQLVPADGVYAARCSVAGKVYPTALSVGTMPTFGDNARQVEAHLIGLDADLYGKTLRVEVLDWVREQWKFNGVDPLKARMAKDLTDIVRRQDLVVGRPIARVG